MYVCLSFGSVVHTVVIFHMSIPLVRYFLITSVFLVSEVLCTFILFMCIRINKSVKYSTMWYFMSFIWTCQHNIVFLYFSVMKYQLLKKIITQVCEAFAVFENHFNNTVVVITAIMTMT